MQVAREVYFGKRAQFYTAKTYSDQIVAGGRYGTLREVFFLGILNFKLFSNDIPYKSEHMIFERNSLKPTLHGQTYVFLELDKFHKKPENIDTLNTMIERWTYFFKYAEKMSSEEWDKLTTQKPIMRKVQHELSSAFWNREELVAYEGVKKKALDLSSIIHGQRDEAVAEGMAKGEAKGKAEGEAKGRAEEKIEMARKLLARGFSIEDTCNLTGLSVVEINDACK